MSNLLTLRIAPTGDGGESGVTVGYQWEHIWFKLNLYKDFENGEDFGLVLMGTEGLPNLFRVDSQLLE